MISVRFRLNSTSNLQIQQEAIDSQTHRIRYIYVFVRAYTHSHTYITIPVVQNFKISKFQNYNETNETISFSAQNVK